MESILHSSTSATCHFPPTILKSISRDGFSASKSSCLFFANRFSSSSSASSLSSSSSSSSCPRRRLVIVGAKKKSKDDRMDSHSFVPKPDEATGLFPEAVLLKEKKVQEDGQLMPEFADAEEKELFEYLNLQLESGLNVKQMRHYEVVYLIHEKHEEDVGKVNEKIEDFLREKRGKVWRFEDWGLRRLAYKINKATKAHYILMNFELDAKWINDFKSMLDKDEMVIRHLVMKQDKAITEVQPPPPEFHTLRSGMDDDNEEADGEIELEYEDGEEYDDEDDEDWDDEEGEDIDDYDEDDDGVILLNADEEDGEVAGNKSSKSQKRSLRAQPLAR
ncbi:protein WHAT'S THIS FACTOR 1 homolog, chloroplastic [Punica granatum]|uniref:Uncharacterized protein n=2 Tax=Punica granatum TaxID=22663 RepID=A0A218WF15_PUNGR|nr:protein WHAT'S THIS FACTOR 1 homolog, chloroplastic [Punica granatum]OWM71079.1 hypothetical protein CDL15_Pgr011206 [Punica granatum]PKI72810.1 hypothetical protein CRG98_006790 [Punica granatum]